MPCLCCEPTDSTSLATYRFQHCPYFSTITLEIPHHRFPTYFSGRYPRLLQMIGLLLYWSSLPILVFSHLFGDTVLEYLLTLCSYNISQRTASRILSETFPVCPLQNILIVSIETFDSILNSNETELLILRARENPVSPHLPSQVHCHP